MCVEGEGIPLANAVSDKRLDWNLALLGIKHDKVVEGDRALDAETFGLAVPRDAAFVESAERVRATLGSNRDAQTRAPRRFLPRICHARAPDRPLTCANASDQ